MSLNGKVKAGKSLTGKIENIRQIADLTEMFNKVAPAVKSCEDATEYAKIWAENARTAHYSASNSAKRADEAADNAEEAAENAEEQTIYDATVSDSGDLLLICKNGREINAGNVKGEAGKDAEYNLVANALKGNKSGNPIAIPDVSPIPHEINVKLSGSESGGKNLFHFPTNETVSGKYEFENPEDEEGYGNPTWSYTTEVSKMTISDPCGDITSMIYKEYYLRDLLKEVDPNKTLTISVTGDHPAVDVYIGDVCLYAGDTVENFTFTLSDLDENASLSLMSYGGEGTIYIQIEEGETATEYEDYVGSEKTGFYVEEVFNSSETDQFASDITESGIYVIESVFTSEDSDVTSITFKDGKKVQTTWIDGEPFAEGDVVYVEVNGDNQIFSIVRGAVVQKYGINLFDQEKVFDTTKQGGGKKVFAKQEDGTWLADNYHGKIAFEAPAKGKMFCRATVKSTEKHTSSPFQLQAVYVGGSSKNVLVLPTTQTKWETLSGFFDVDEAFSYIRLSFGGNATTKESYYIKDIIFSYADAPYEPYTGEQETLTADENGNLSILGNGESMTLIGEEGVTMEAEYNRDINKAFAELQNAIISLGGNV